MNLYQRHPRIGLAFALVMLVVFWPCVLVWFIGNTVYLLFRLLVIAAKTSYSQFHLLKDAYMSFYDYVKNWKDAS
jgi:hypothetical protein